jgi:DNA polymerase delta subunit 3
MLYDFHHTENKKKPQSVNATYVITGIQKPQQKDSNGVHAENRDDGDDIMQGSPYLPSSMPHQDATPDEVPTTSIILAREEDLDDAKSTFESISSIHIYSLQPTVLQDHNVLTDVHREMLAAHAHEDPLEYGKHWGMIQNKNVKVSFLKFCGH